jgi:hypothetical protein
MELHDRLPSRDIASNDQTDSYSQGSDLPPPDIFDPVIEAYKKDIDRTLLIENLRKPVAERLAKFQSFMNALGEMRGAALPPDLREKLFGKQ